MSPCPTSFTIVGHYYDGRVVPSPTLSHLLTHDREFTKEVRTVHKESEYKVTRFVGVPVQIEVTLSLHVKRTQGSSPSDIYTRLLTLQIVWKFTYRSELMEVQIFRNKNATIIGRFTSKVQ